MRYLIMKFYFFFGGGRHINRFKNIVWKMLVFDAKNFRHLNLTRRSSILIVNILILNLFMTNEQILRLIQYIVIIEIYTFCD